MIKVGEYGNFSLEAAEIGDRLMVSNGDYGLTEYSMVTITKLTDTRITTSDGKQWMRASQRCVGRTDTWGRGPGLRPYDEKQLAKSKREARHRKLERELNDTQWRYFSLEFLEQISALVKSQDQKKKSET